MTWIRRNRLPLVLLAVLLPLTVFSTAGLELLGQQVTDPTPVEVADKKPFTVFGATWKVRGSREFDGTGANGIPKGTALVAALIDVTPIAGTSAPRDSACSVSLDAPGAQGRRSWQELPDAEDYGYRRTPGTADACSVHPAGPVTMEVVFLTPVDTIGRSGVVILHSDSRKLTRFRLALHQD